MKGDATIFPEDPKEWGEQYRVCEECSNLISICDREGCNKTLFDGDVGRDNPHNNIGNNVYGCDAGLFCNECYDDFYASDDPYNEGCGGEAQD